VRTNILFVVLASDFGVELVVGEGPFREPPTVMQATIIDDLPCLLTMDIFQVAYNLSIKHLNRSSRAYSTLYLGMLTYSGPYIDHELPKGPSHSQLLHSRPFSKINCLPKQ